MQIRTTHGRIDTNTKKYHCRRGPTHYFKKFKGFGLSTTEVGKIDYYGVTSVVLHYIGKRGEIIYNIPLEKIKTFTKYSFNGDIQYILPENKIRKTNPQQDLKQWLTKSKNV